MRNTNVRDGEPGWFASLLGAAVLIAGGFALGLVAGVVSEEPELVVGHLVGRSEEVAWQPDGEPEFTSSDGEGVLLDAEPVPEAVAVDEIDVLEPARPAAEPPPPAVATAPPPLEVRSVPPARPAAVPVSPPARRATRKVRDIESLPARTPAAVLASGFSVQVGAFADGDAAEDVRQKLLSKGFDTYVVPAKRSGDGKWRVRVGPVPDKGAAEELASRLKTEERLPTWVVAEGGG